MVVVAQVHPLDEPLIVEVLQSVARKIKIVFRHDAKRADGGQRAAVFAVELVDSVAINDQLPLVAARANQGRASGSPEDRFHPGPARRTRAAIRRCDPARRNRVVHSFEQHRTWLPSGA